MIVPTSSTLNVSKVNVKQRNIQCMHTGLCSYLFYIKRVGRRTHLMSVITRTQYLSSQVHPPLTKFRKSPCKLSLCMIPLVPWSSVGDRNEGAGTTFNVCQNDCCEKEDQFGRARQEILLHLLLLENVLDAYFSTFTFACLEFTS